MSESPTTTTCQAFVPKRQVGSLRSYCSTCGCHADMHAYLRWPLRCQTPQSSTSSSRPGSRASQKPIPTSPTHHNPHTYVSPNTRNAPAPPFPSNPNPAGGSSGILRTSPKPPYAPLIPRPTSPPAGSTSEYMILVSEAQIRARIQSMAAEISHFYTTHAIPGGAPLLVVGLMKGAFMFFSDLAKQLTVEHTIDFMVVSSYGKKTTSGEVHIVNDIREAIAGRHVLLVEDLVDSGKTLEAVREFIKIRKPASVRLAVLCRKVDKSDLAPEWLGFDVPNVWLVGYGMDFNDQFRSIPVIAELSEKVYKK